LNYSSIINDILKQDNNYINSNNEINMNTKISLQIEKFEESTELISKIKSICKDIYDHIQNINVT
jgi:hypothetical protein